MSKLLKNSKNKCLMGVVNITPNSFSDGGESNSLESFTQKIICLKDYPIIDIGAESTAPFNDSISLEEEKKRFDKTLLHPDFDISLLEDKILSIDTYKIEIMEYVSAHIKDWGHCQLLFNDVSGKLDKNLIDYLKRNPDVIYVYSHNLCPTREMASEHMNYVLDIALDESLDAIATYFILGLKILKARGVENKIIIDPCFGFSKNSEQNNFLLDNFSEFEKIFIDYDIIMGISRKSFIKKRLGRDDLESLDKYTRMQISEYNAIHRVH